MGFHCKVFSIRIFFFCVGDVAMLWEIYLERSLKKHEPKRWLIAKNIGNCLNPCLNVPAREARNDVSFSVEKSVNLPCHWPSAHESSFLSSTRKRSPIATKIRLPNMRPRNFGWNLSLSNQWEAFKMVLHMQGSIDSCQNRVAANQYHMTISQTQE